MTPQERKNCGRSREDKKGPTFDKRSHAKDRHAKDRSIARSDSKRVGPRNEIMRYKDIHSQKVPKLYETKLLLLLTQAGMIEGVLGALETKKLGSSIYASHDLTPNEAIVMKP
ncbi:hypothetical protein Ct61P_06366 [Colletotrichum tofieldiae]|nr:hypothetical protein Ct61P_06366 [Colletotrichum tofieldiae]